jgi:hypothetical protein
MPDRGPLRDAELELLVEAQARGEPVTDVPTEPAAPRAAESVTRVSKAQPFTPSGDGRA